MNDLNTGRRAVILTTDVGTEIDDQWALAHLALSPALELLGVVTTHAPNAPAPAAEFTAGVAREVLNNLPIAVKPPVFEGSSVPLVDKSTPHMNAGVEFIIEQSKRYSSENRLTVLAIGATTDVASALVADPTLQDRIAVVGMGFNDWNCGDEWNVNNDVKAWQVILDSRADVVIGCASVCKRDLLMNSPRACELFGNCGGSGKYLLDMLNNWLTANVPATEAVTGIKGTWPLWDSITVAYLLGMADVERRARPVLLDDKTFGVYEEGGRIVEWITGVHTDSLWKDLANILS